MLDFYEEKRNLAQEILEKADLEYLAAHIEEIEEFNLVGSSPKTYFSGLSMKVLRCLNSKQGLEILKKERARTPLQEFYQKAPFLFDSPWNLCQCLFWLDFMSCDNERVICSEVITVLKMLRTFRTKEEYDIYKKYYLARKVIGNRIYLPLFPHEIEYLEMQEKASCVLGCLEHEKLFNEMLFQQYARRRKQFEYQDAMYEVVILKNLTEFWEESEAQCNCVWGRDYIEDAAMGRKLILSLRKRGKIKIPYVTIEIRISGTYFEIKQAKEKYNCEINEELKGWIRNYCAERNVNFHECEDLAMNWAEKERRYRLWEDWCYCLMD